MQPYSTPDAADAAALALRALRDMETALLAARHDPTPATARGALAATGAALEALTIAAAADPADPIMRQAVDRVATIDAQLRAMAAAGSGGAR